MALPQIPGFELRNDRYYKLTPQKARTQHAEPMKPPKKKAKSTRATLPGYALPRCVIGRMKPPNQSRAASHNLRLAQYAGLTDAETMLPDAFAIDDTITAICVDDADPAILRVGTSGGALATKTKDMSFLRNYGIEYNISPWKLDWCALQIAKSNCSEGAGTLAVRSFHCVPKAIAFCASPVLNASTKRSASRAASFGPPSSAMFATSDTAASLASIILNPRKTSIWSCALSQDFIALGCDDAVLLSHDPTRTAMRSLATRSAVMALDVYETCILYGLRSGDVRLADVRTHAAASSGQSSISLNMPITHLKVVDNTCDLVVATFGNGLKLYDIRWLNRPRSTLTGHGNSCYSDLGMAVNQDVLAMAADDSMVNMWSLRTGERITRATRRSLLWKQFDEPIRAMAFAPAHGRESASLWVANGGALERYLVV